MRLVQKNELQNVAHEALSLLPQKNTASIIALRGDLGAGKTTFTQALAQELGVQDTVQSPTYVLMKSYRASHPRFSSLVHIDAYRLERPEEFDALRLETLLPNAQTLICVEWPERAGERMPKPDAEIVFSSEGVGEGERYIEIKSPQV